MPESQDPEGFDAIVQEKLGDVKAKTAGIEKEFRYLEVLDQLKQEKLGREILIDPHLNKPGQPKPLPDAYVLPITEGMSEFLVLCKDGRMLSLVPPRGTRNANFFTQHFSPRPDPIIFNSRQVSDIPTLSRYYRQYGFLGLDSDTESDTALFPPLVMKSINTACTLARKNSDVREYLQRQVLTRYIDNKK